MVASTKMYQTEHTSQPILHCINDSNLNGKLVFRVCVACDKIAVIMIATNSFLFMFYDNLKCRCEIYADYQIMHPFIIHSHQIADMI